MSRFNYREELVRNAEAVGKLYQKVILSWTDKLLREYRYRKTISEEAILQLAGLVRDKLAPDKKNVLFNAYLLKKESTKADAHLHSEADLFSTPKAKIAHEELNETAVKTEPSKSVLDYQEEEYVDDLAEFQTPPEHKAEVKMQPLPEQVKEQREASESSSSEADYSERIEQRLGSAVLGTFCSFHIKRKPKEEKITIELENVFVKYAHSHCENYHSKIACELTKIEKEDIKELRQ